MSAVQSSSVGRAGGEAVGHRRWAIAEGWLPARGRGPAPEFVSHETASILNAGADPAHVEITIFFSDRDPAGPYRLTVGPRRTLHVRFDDLEDPEPIPRETDFASLLESDAPVVVQHTRLDMRRPDAALMTSIACPVG